MLEDASELAALVGVTAACAALGVPRSSFYQTQAPPRQLPQPHPPSPRALTDIEQQVVRDLLNSERFVDRAPRTVYAILLDEGRYLCSWRTMYRILVADAATRERRKVRQHPSYTRPELLATGPCQVWSWDITKLRGPVAGVWYNLYVILDIFSRKIVGWLIAEHEDAALAEVLIVESCAREGC
jgi:putative transposase